MNHQMDNRNINIFNDGANNQFHLDGVSMRRRNDPLNPYQAGKQFSKAERWFRDLSYTAEQTENSYGTSTEAHLLYSGIPSTARLRVLTQNLWANPLTTPDVAGRVDALGKALADVDVACFQEVYHPRERDALRRSGLIHGLFQSRYFEPGCGVFTNTGTGMLVLSRYPIIETAFQRFMVSGRPHRAGAGNSLHAARGAALIRIMTKGGPVDIYVAHLLGEWRLPFVELKETEDPLRAQRLSQAFELAHFVRLTARSPLVLLCCDLAAGPNSLRYGLQRSFARMQDAITSMNPDSESKGDQDTTGLPENCYTKPGELRKRQCYIFYKIRATPAENNAHWKLAQASRQIIVAQKSVILPQGGPISRHAGVRAEFIMDTRDGNPPDEEAFPLGPLMVKVLSILRLGIHAAEQRGQRQKGIARLFGLLFLVLLLISCLQDCRASFQAAFVLLSGLIVLVGVVFFMFSYIFTKEELNGLKEVYHSARNIDIHLPIDEAYGCSGFDTSQLEGYMNDYYR